MSESETGTFKDFQKKLSKPVVLGSNVSYTRTVQLVVFSLLLSFGFVLYISSNFNIIVGFSVLLLALLFYILLINYGNNAGIPYALQ